MFDDIFRDGAFAEARLDAAGVLVMRLAAENKDEATKQSGYWLVSPRSCGW